MMRHVKMLRYTSTGHNIFLLVVVAQWAQSACGGLWEWQGASETGREYAIGDPPPRAPRLPGKAACNFGGLETPCEAAHNYFFDFPPEVNASGSLFLWENNACSPAHVLNTKNVTETSTRAALDDVIAFVLRGGCSFAAKVQNILASTGVDDAFPHRRVAAVAIVDYQGSLGLEAPGLGEARGVDVPVVLVPYATAARLFPEALTGEMSASGFPATTAAAASDTAAALGDRPPLAVSSSAAGSSADPISLDGSVILISATLDSLRGRGTCQCAVEAPTAMRDFHVMHREGYDGAFLTS